MTTTMRAAVLRNFGDPFVVEDVLIDDPGPGEVSVAIRAVAICGSDIHAARGGWGGELPIILGHEAAGVVEAVGSGVDRVRRGDHVVVTLLRVCGACSACGRREPHLCSGDMPIATESRIAAFDGAPIRQGIYVGAFAERVVVHESQVVAIPPSIPFASASLLACGVITGFGAVVNTAGVPRGSSVCVIGAGGVGLNTIQAAIACGADPVVAIDSTQTKLDAAIRFGATHAVTAFDDGVSALVDGGADYVFVTVGNARAMESGLGLVRPGGTLVVVGITEIGGHMSIDTSEFASSARRIIGSKMGSTNILRDIPKLVDAYLDGDLLLDELITGRFDLAQINEAIGSTERGEALRNVVLMEDGA